MKSDKLATAANFCEHNIVRTFSSNCFKAGHIAVKIYLLSNILKNMGLECIIS